MTSETHQQLANFIWEICNLLRGPYKRNEYRKVILPLTVLRRFDCLLYPTKDQVLAAHDGHKSWSDKIRFLQLSKITGHQFYNVSKIDFRNLLDDPDRLMANLNGYIKGYSENVREIMKQFAFEEQIVRMHEKELLYNVIKAFKAVDLGPERVDNMQMGYIFEELIRIGAEQSNEEAGEHFTPREVIKLMVQLLLNPDSQNMNDPDIVRTIYDPACGTGGMLSTAEEYIRGYNSTAKIFLHGQDVNDESLAICQSDMLIKGEDADRIKLGDSFTQDGFANDTFDYMLANPPFGVTWKQQEKFITDEHERKKFEGRFGPGLPRVNDGSLLFLLHMIAKMQKTSQGSRIAIVFNGSPLFTGDAGSGESDIRKWIIEKDYLETIVALPDQLFYNTGISTYIWILTNRKEVHRKGKIQLVDARNHYIKMRKSLGNKRNKIGDGQDNEVDHIAEIVKIVGRFAHNETAKVKVDDQVKTIVVSKVFDNQDFGFSKITVERPLRLNFQASPERIAKLDQESGFVNLAVSAKKNESVRAEEIALGKQRQEKIRGLLAKFGEVTKCKVFKNRSDFVDELTKFEKKQNTRLEASERKAVLSALCERDETADVCTDSKGNPEPDPDLRDTESVPLKEDIQKYFKREVLPHVPDAWIDGTKTKVGYEIPLNRHFYTYEPPRPLEEIENDIKKLEREIISLLGGVSQ